MSLFAKNGSIASLQKEFDATAASLDALETERQTLRVKLRGIPLDKLDSSREALRLRAVTAQIDVLEDRREGLLADLSRARMDVDAGARAAKVEALTEMAQQGYVTAAKLKDAAALFAGLARSHLEWHAKFEECARGIAPSDWQPRAMHGALPARASSHFRALLDKMSFPPELSDPDCLTKLIRGDIDLALRDVRGHETKEESHDDGQQQLATAGK